jgi:glycosyltransferase involved in cell wall biosynthesis
MSVFRRPAFAVLGFLADVLPPDASVSLALALRRLRCLPCAMHLLTRATRRHPSHGHMTEVAGRLAVESRRFDHVAEFAEQLLTRHAERDFSVKRFGLGPQRCRRVARLMRDADARVRFLEHAARAFPAEPSIVADLGRLAFGRGAFADAERLLRVAVSMPSAATPSDAYLKLSQLLRRAARFGEAADVAEQGLALHADASSLVLELARSEHAMGRVYAPMRRLERLEASLRPNALHFLQRLRGMAAVLDGAAAFPGLDTAGRSGPAEVRVGAVSRANGAALVLNASLPHQVSGYTIRSHMLARQLRMRGVALTALTRLGFPWDLDGHRAAARASADTVDGVVYRRLVDAAVDRRRLPEATYLRHYATSLADAIRRADVAVVHAASNYVNGVAAAIAAQETGRPFVYEVRGLWHQTTAATREGFEDSDGFRYQESMERSAARAADAVLVISDDLRRHAREAWGIDDRRLFATTNAVDTQHFVPRPRDADLVASLGSDGRATIGFIGSITAYEGLDDLVRALAMLDADTRPLLVVVGDGPYAPQLRALVDDAGCTDDVRFVGRVPFADVPRFYSCFDLCVYPRKDLPVCRVVPPLKPLEAMAMAVPVVVSDLPPLTELVGGSGAAVVVAPDAPEALAAAIERLLGDAAALDRIGQAGATWVRANRSWDRVADDVTAVYGALGLDVGSGATSASDPAPKT